MSEQPLFPYGRHKGEPVTVASPDYLIWCLSVPRLRERYPELIRPILDQLAAYIVDVPRLADYMESLRWSHKAENRGTPQSHDYWGLL